MKKLILIIISFSFCTLLYGQKDSLWHLSGQTNDGTVKAYSVKSIKGSCRNVLIFKKGQLWDTLDLCGYASMLPHFKDTCWVQSIQLDGQGLNEIILSWERKIIEKNIVVYYKFYTIWDLDTKKNIFYMTPDYYRLSTGTIYELDQFNKIVDSIMDPDSCIYKCDFGINTDGQIIVNNLGTNIL